jgi:hypothetical protein
MLRSSDSNTYNFVFQNCPPPPKSKNKKITLPHWESASPVENRKKIIKTDEKLNSSNKKTNKLISFCPFPLHRQFSCEC